MVNTPANLHLRTRFRKHVRAVYGNYIGSTRSFIVVEHVPVFHSIEHHSTRTEKITQHGTQNTYVGRFSAHNKLPSNCECIVNIACACGRFIECCANRHKLCERQKLLPFAVYSMVKPLDWNVSLSSAAIRPHSEPQPRTVLWTSARQQLRCGVLCVDRSSGHVLGCSHFRARTHTSAHGECCIDNTHIIFC